MFSRFASFIEVGGRTGLGYRDTAQDSMTIPHSNPEKSRSRIIELLRGLTSKGYGLHLFQPEWFDPEIAGKQQSFKSPTVIPTPSKSEIVHGIEDACSDDALWLIASICEYIKETGEVSLLDEKVTYADGGVDTVYEHMMRILDFSAREIGANGICKGLRADWNDCLNLGGGESAMVSFLHYWAITHFLALSRFAQKTEYIDKYEKMAQKVKRLAKIIYGMETGISVASPPVAAKLVPRKTKKAVFAESNAWAVFSGLADKERAELAMDAVNQYLYTEYGLMLNAPSIQR